MVVGLAQSDYAIQRSCPERLVVCRYLCSSHIIFIGNDTTAIHRVKAGSKQAVAEACLKDFPAFIADPLVYIFTSHSQPALTRKMA